VQPAAVQEHRGEQPPPLAVGPDEGLAEGAGGEERERVIPDEHEHRHADEGRDDARDRRRHRGPPEVGTQGLGRATARLEGEQPVELLLVEVGAPRGAAFDALQAVARVPQQRPACHTRCRLVGATSRGDVPARFEAAPDREVRRAARSAEHGRAPAARLLEEVGAAARGEKPALRGRERDTRGAASLDARERAECPTHVAGLGRGTDLDAEHGRGARRCGVERGERGLPASRPGERQHLRQRRPTVRRGQAARRDQLAQPAAGVLLVAPFGGTERPVETRLGHQPRSDGPRASAAKPTTEGTAAIAATSGIASDAHEAARRSARTAQWKRSPRASLRRTTEYSEYPEPNATA
jgi:hypothetical protein